MLTCPVYINQSDAGAEIKPRLDSTCNTPTSSAFLSITTVLRFKRHHEKMVYYQHIYEKKGNERICISFHFMF